MRVLVLSKREFDNLMVDNGITDENVEKRTGIVLISINDSSREETYFKENHINVIVMKFDDIEREGEVSPTNKGECKVFDDAMAQELYEFIKRNRDRETCIVHCEAGISRSGAVGSFVNGYTQGDWERFKRENSFISPNGRVLRMLNHAKYNDFE